MDAASRGLKVALVERDDFASATSSRSTKLIHGGGQRGALVDSQAQCGIWRRR